VGVILWSVSTFLTGFATSFWMLIVLRAGVAIGEAVLMPIAMSMISDLFPKDRRTFPVTFYTMTGVVMAKGAFIVGAGALALADHIVPITGGSPWRIMFMLVALPGPLLILLFAFFGRDPGRRVEEQAAPPEAVNTRAFIAHLLANKSIYLPVFLGTGGIFMIGLGLSAWTPTMLIREHGVPAASAGVYFGSAAVVGGLLGTTAVGLLIRRLGRDGMEKGLFRTALLVTALTLPVLGLLIGSSDLRLVLLGVGVGTFGIMGATTFVPHLMQQVTPRALIGRTTAVYLLFNNIMGMGMGPFLVTRVAKFYADQPGSIGKALSAVSWGALAVALVCFAYALFFLSRRGSSARYEAELAT
jgi:MFS family permease